MSRTEKTIHNCCPKCKTDLGKFETAQHYLVAPSKVRCLGCEQVFENGLALASIYGLPKEWDDMDTGWQERVKNSLKSTCFSDTFLYIFCFSIFYCIFAMLLLPAWLGWSLFLAIAVGAVIKMPSILYEKELARIIQESKDRKRWKSDVVPYVLNYRYYKTAADFPKEVRTYVERCKKYLASKR